MNRHFYLFGAVALPLLMASCSNDLLDAEQQGQDLVKGNVVKIDNDFRLFAGRSSSNDASQTRAEWLSWNNGAVFYWMPAGVVTQNDEGYRQYVWDDVHQNWVYVDGTGCQPGDDHSKPSFTVELPSSVTFDAVGLCWLGAGEAGDNIFTNYKFVHDGWLEQNAISMNENYTGCDKTTGKYQTEWNWVKYFAADAKYAAAGKDLTIGTAEVTTSDGKKEAIGVGKLDEEVYASNRGKDGKKISNLNLSKGSFRTENKTIFGGKYLAYYPYDENMVEQGRLTAKTFTEQMAPVSYNDRMLRVGDYTFCAGYMAEEIKGGTTASALTMEPISGLLSIREQDFKGDDKPGTNPRYNIEHLIIMSAKGNITKEIAMKASSFIPKEENAPADPLEGAESTFTQNVVVDFVDNDGNITSFKTNNYFNSDGQKTEDKYNRVIVPILPSEIPDLDLMWVNEDGKALITKETLNVNVGKGKVCNVNSVGDVTYDMYVAWDWESLENAIANAGANATSSKQQKILVVNKIVLDENITIPSYVTITGEWRNEKVGELVVPANNKTNPTVLTAASKSTIACDVTIEGLGCCHTNTGVLDAQGMTFAKGTYDKGTTDPNHVNTLTNNGLLLFNAGLTTSDFALRTNVIDGNIENTPLMYQVDGVTSIDVATGEPYRIPFETNDFESFSFDDMKVKGSVVAVRTLATVEINGNFNNNTATSKDGKTRKDALLVLEKRDEAKYASNDMDARLIVNQKAVLDNFATIHNQGTVANNSGSASGIKNEVHATYINMIGGQLNGYKMQKEANSNFIAQVDNSIDSRYTTALNEHLANIIEFLKVNEKYKTNASAQVYRMQNINNKDLKYLINATGETVTLVGKKSVDDPVQTYAATIGAIEVADGATLNINSIVDNSKTSPVCLNVDNSAYNATHKADAKVLVNKKYPVAIPAVKTLSGSNFVLATNGLQNKVTFTTQGDVLFSGTEFIGKAQGGVYNLPIVTINGNMSVYGTTTFDKKVVKGTITKNLTIGGRINFNSDVKVKVGENMSTEYGHIQNDGFFNIETSAILSSPAIVYCKSYNMSGGNWGNGGRPTPFNAGGVEEGDYNW